MTGFQLVSSDSSMSRINYNVPVYDQKEEFDPSLQRFNTIEKLVAYCDSLYAEKAYTISGASFEEQYPDIVSSVIKKRFYHGYSVYGFSTNYVAMMLEQVSVNGLSAIVLPNDILKYPYAACSQQSIVMMEILKEKGFATRKIGFKGKMGGHFAFETYYNGSWHYFDPNMEPDNAILMAHNKPGIAYLTSHTDVLLAAYKQYPKEKVMDLFPTFWYGKANTSAAPQATIFHKVTKFLSYTLWSFFLLAFIWARKKYNRLSKVTVKGRSMIVPKMEPIIGKTYYPNFNEGLELRV